ncbi:hypothetical protein O181_128143 [Austropuccinia psidii MF-1]|uniref:Uncharacterized protein n=1 Tax=Austropuccinia psidii MF-1 TaxID=1389203 RepID=A0A9Q3KVP1_9BASI|nr:hypothetical protein [Austropuccinia psidii MF-1]
MSFHFIPLPSSLKIKTKPPPLCQSSNNSDNVMVRTKPDSAHHQNDLNDVESTIPLLIEHHEDNNTKSNHKRKLTQSQRQHIHDSKQIMSHIGHSNTEYKKFSTISIDKK